MENSSLPGLYIEKTCVGNKYEPGTVLPYVVHVPPMALNKKNNLALYVLMEHNPETMGKMLSQFMDEELIPPGMIIHYGSGTLPPSLEYGTPRGMRAEEYDQFGPDFTNFIVEELIPQALKSVDITIDPSPDLHFITGGSSGGLAAWNAVWFRNDFFRRAFLSSPTFSAMRGGEEAMILVRKTETKPIRLYITVGTEEPDYFFGSSLYAAQNAAQAFEFAGYDFRFEQFDGEGHCARREDGTLWRRIMTFIWANWQEQPVLPIANQIRIRNLIRNNSRWQRFSGEMPGKKPLTVRQGTYTSDDHNIYVEQNGKTKIAASGFGKITGLGISPDRWRIIIADRTSRFLFAMSVCENGTLYQKYKLAPLHLAHDCHVIGANDITVLSDGRILSATELGVQGTVPFGLTDLILPLPNDLPAEKIAVRGNTLFAASGNHIFFRELKTGELLPDTGPKAPTAPGYGDNFSYSRSHLIQH